MVALLSQIILDFHVVIIHNKNADSQWCLVNQDTWLPATERGQEISWVGICGDINPWADAKQTF